MAEIWVLVLGEIDLSVGYVAGIGGTITAILSTTHGLPWWVAVLGGIAATAAIGAVWGVLVIRLRLPSFVVTLAGLLGMEGVLLYLVNANGTGGTIRIVDPVLIDIANGNLSTIGRLDHHDRQCGGGRWPSSSCATVIVGSAVWSPRRWPSPCSRSSSSPSPESRWC